MPRSPVKNDAVIVSSFDDNFRNTCIELIKINFPSALFPDSGLPINALSINDDIIFKIMEEDSIPAIIQLVNDDLITLRKDKFPITEIYYLTHSKNLENVFYVKRVLSSVHKSKIKIQFLPYSEISKILVEKKSYKSPPLFVSENISELFDKFFPSHNRFPSIFEEIVSFVYSQNLTSIVSKKTKDAFLKLQIKIPVNFSSDNDREQVLASFNKYWPYKERVRSYFAINFNTDPYRILSLLYKIQNEFQKLNDKHEVNYPINYPTTFLSLAHSLIPNGRTNSSEYESVALAIVYYFFEMCDYGERFQGEQLSFFQEQIK